MSNQFNTYLLDAVNMIAKDKSIPQEVIRDFLVDSIKKAFVKSNYEDNLEVFFDLNTGNLTANKLYTVVEDSDDFDEYLHVLDTDPKVKALGLKVGDIYKESYDITKEFKQQQVQQILQSFKQKIVEISNQRVYQAWTPMIGEVILAEIEKEDKKGNFFTVNLENQVDKEGNPLEPTLGFIGKKELNPLEELDVGKKYHFVVSEVKEQSKFCPVILSRASDKLVEYYMNLEIPEIDDGSIKIEKIARVAGIKTKVLVSTKTLLVEPAAVCVGTKGSRVKTISALLGGEKIEIYSYTDDPLALIVDVLDKSKVAGIKLEEHENGMKEATIVVYDEALPQVIGKRGSNVRLASLLTGWNINVITLEEAEHDKLSYLKANSVEFKKHFDKPIQKHNDALVGDDELDILSLNDNDIDEIISNAISDDNAQHPNEAEPAPRKIEDEDLNYDLIDSDELSDLNEMFGDEVQNALNNKK